jgi:NADH-quinone oxidoreductase subunit J
MDLSKNMPDSKTTITKIAGAVLGGTLLVIIVAATRKMNLKDTLNPNTFNAQTGMVEGLGKILYRDYVLPFELISVLFFVAMVGAVMLGKREAGERNF